VWTRRVVVQVFCLEGRAYAAEAVGNGGKRTARSCAGVSMRGRYARGRRGGSVLCARERQRVRVSRRLLFSLFIEYGAGALVSLLTNSCRRCRRRRELRFTAQFSQGESRGASRRSQVCQVAGNEAGGPRMEVKN